MEPIYIYIYIIYWFHILYSILGKDFPDSRFQYISNISNVPDR